MKHYLHMISLYMPAPCKPKQTSLLIPAFVAIFSAPPDRSDKMKSFSEEILKYSLGSLQILVELAKIKSIISNLPMFPSDWIRGSFDRRRKLNFDSNASTIIFRHWLSKYFKWKVTQKVGTTLYKCHPQILFHIDNRLGI